MEKEFFIGWRTLIQPPIPRTSIPRTPKTVDPKRLWKLYLIAGNFSVRLIRSASIAVTLFALSVVVFIGLNQGLPKAPYRGESAHVTDLIVTLLSVLSLLFLIAFVFDTTSLSKRMIRRLNRGNTNWGLIKDLGLLMYRQKAEFDWWDVQFVAKHTARIAPLVYFPFIALFLMALARNPIFGAWHYSHGLVAIYVLSSFMCLMSAFQLRRAAEESRELALEKLHNYLTEVIGRNKNVEEFIRYRIEEVETIKEGAYKPFILRPEVQAIGLVAGTIFHLYLSP